VSGCERGVKGGQRTLAAAKRISLKNLENLLPERHEGHQGSGCVAIEDEPLV
jgi:hypothetical protein